MRSVCVHLINASLEEVRSCLNAFAQSEADARWLYPRHAELPCLYIELTSILTEDDEPELVASVIKALGTSPEISVLADVSGRVPGYPEVVAFVECMLTRFTGVATDDYTEHGWSVQEIQSGTTVEGRRFFNCEG